MLLVGTVGKAMTRILLIDDDEELSELVAEYLTSEGFTVDSLHRGEQSVERVLSGDYALVVLDVMLPGLSGFEILRRLRARSRVPIMMLTARTDDVDRIVGLELGADDYLPKPFNARELVARIRAILRRVHAEPIVLPRHAPVNLGDIELDAGARVVRRAGEIVELTTVEFDLLKAFLRVPGQVATREWLTHEVLGRRFSPLDRSIDMHVSNLRRKLGPGPDGDDRIKAVRSVGYILVHSSGEDEEITGE
jgi:two-component system response regulator CpxR